MSKILTSLVALAALPCLASAQAPPQLGAAPQTPLHYELDIATGTVRRTSAQAADARAAGGPGTEQATIGTYVNNCLNGGFVDVGSSELVDWGVKSAGASEVVNGFVFGYSTDALDPSVGGPGASVEISFFQFSFGNGSLGGNVARFAFTGLPGSLDGSQTSSIVSVDLTGGSEFQLFDGPIGYGYCSSDPGATGPLLVDITACPNGTVDAYDQYNCPALVFNYVGTFDFGGPPNPTASFYLEILEDDGLTKASSTFLAGSAVNTDFLWANNTQPVLGKDWQLTVASTFLHTISTIVGYADRLPDGAVFLNSSLGTFELLVDPSSPFAFSQTVVSLGSFFQTLPLPLDTSLVGVTVYVQGVQYGAGLGYSLSNAYEANLGF